MATVEWFTVERGANEELFQIISDVMVKLIVGTFETNVEINGKATVLASIKPYRINYSRPIVDESRKILQIESNGPEALLATYIFASSCVAPVTYGEVREKGAIGINQGCIFKQCSPELCMFLSHFTTLAICEFINPEFESVWTNHITSGDDYCRYVFKKKSDPASVINDLGAVKVKMDRFPIPVEQARGMRVWALTSFWYETIAAFTDLNGSESVERTLCPSARKIGQEVGSRLKESHGDVWNDIGSLGNLFNSISLSFNRRGNVRLNKTEYQKEVTDCPWQIFTKEMCVQWQSMLQGILDVLNPKYELSFDRMKTTGEGSCHWSIQNRTSKNDDPIMILSTRLAKGEISEDEYVRKMSLLTRYHSSH